MFSTTYNKEEKLWHAADLPSLYNPAISMGQALLSSMATFGPKIAQISDSSGKRMTFDELRTKTIRAAQNLQARGYKPKQLFGIVATNSDHVAPIVIASLAMGCPINALDVSYRDVDLIEMFKITEPVVIFCDISCYELVSKYRSKTKIFTFGGSVGDSEPVENLFKETHNEHKFIPAKVDGPNDTAVIICSSGTTALAKCICMSHAALLDSMVRIDLTNCSDVMLGFNPLSWISGWIILLRGTLSGATRIITTEDFSPELQLRLIEQYKVTFVFNVPFHTNLMMKSKRLCETDLSSLKILYIGGTKAPFHLKTDVKRHLPNTSLVVVYGLVELCGPIASDYPTTMDKDNVGRLSGACVKIIDDQGNRCGVNVDGEICIKMKHNYKFPGYYGNQQKTVDLFDEEGFMQTGDIGHFDEDGDLFIIDRIKDILVYRVTHVYPSEIDGFLTESPDIKSACVVGIHDDFEGHIPAAVVVRANGSKITEKDIFDMVADRFPDNYKLRGGVYFVDSLPTTANGKVLRRSVLETAAALYNANKAGSPI